MVHTRLMSHVVTGTGDNLSGSSTETDAGPSKSVALGLGLGLRQHNEKLQEGTVAIFDTNKSTIGLFDTNKTSSPTMNLLHLPTEIVEKILSFVPYRTVCHSRAISRKMNEICCGHLNLSFHRLQTSMLARFQNLKAQMPRRESSRRNHPLACESEIIETLHMRLTLLQMTFGKHIERKHVCFFAGDILDEVYRILHYVAATPTLARPYKVTDELFDLSTMAMEYFKERIEPSLPEISCFTSDFLDYANPFNASTSGFGLDDSPVLESFKRNRKAPPPRSTMVLRKRIRRIKQGMKKYNNQLSILRRDIRNHKGRATEQQKLLSDISTRLDDHDKKNEETSRKFSTLLQELNKCKTELQYWRFKVPTVAMACSNCGRPFPAPATNEEQPNQPLPWFYFGGAVPDAELANLIPLAPVDNKDWNLEWDSTVKKLDESPMLPEVLEESSKQDGSKPGVSKEVKPDSPKELKCKDAACAISAPKRKLDDTSSSKDSQDAKKPKRMLKTRKNAGLRRRRRQAFGDFNRGNGLNFGDDFLDVGLQDVDIRPFVSTPADLNECDSLEDKAPCDPQSPFRSISGNCNNLRNPTLGKTVTTFARLLQPAYENGISRPRLNSVTGVPLPSPRLVSTMVHADISNLHNRYSLMLMQFAQFLDHDITFTPVYRGFFASIPDCRSCESPRTVHPECMPIPIPQGDHYYPTVNRTSGERVCLPFMRSLPGQQTLGPREQINQNSAFLDTSQVYGEHSCQARELRSFDGRLNVTRHPVKGKDLLPNSPNHPECKAPSGYCFIAGDGRASEQVALTVIHTLYMREHNRLVEGLRALNPHWDDEKLYQHGRRILTAVQQHISYNEFLPRVLGWNAVNLYELKLRPQGYYKGYNPKCNPAIVNEFAAAAFRIGHSLLRPHIPRMSASYQAIDPPLLLRDGFFNPDKVYQAGIVDEITRGLVSTPMENLDQFITGEITNHLFEDRRIPHSGVDLIALNIQRSRDHALRPYNDYRALCNLKRATTFEDLQREIPPEVIARLKRIYATVDDVDLFPGGMSERPLQGGLVGPTFACIIGIQFRQLRKCDRFWYENENPVLRFTEAQLSEIRKMTLSKILCENMDISSDIQRSSFDQPSNFLNPRVPCHSIPDINLSAWRETPQGCQISGRPVAIGESGFPTPCTSCICTAEGTQCASLRVTDCAQLLREFSRDAILRDDVCAAQCGFLFSADSSTSPGQLLTDVTFTTTGPDAHSRARSLLPQDLIPPPPRLRPPPQGVGRFRPPPLTRFVG